METTVYRQEKPGDAKSVVQKREDLRSPGPGEVLIRVRASSLNFRDFKILNGQIPYPVKPNLIPLSDGAGEVLAVGEGVTRFAVGDRVVNAFNPTWFGGRPLRVRPIQYATALDGWLTTHKVVSAEVVSRMPAHLSFEEAATLPCSGVTAFAALLGISPGDTVLTQGSGGVGLFGIQIARACGARVIATTTSEEKRERLKALGAWEVVNVRTSPEWSKVVRDLTNGNGADRIIETGSPGTLAQSIRAVAFQGKVSILGAAAGTDEPPIDALRLFISQARYECIGVGSRDDLEDLIRLYAVNELRPVIDSTYSFGEFHKAFARLSGRDVFGKIVLTH